MRDFIELAACYVAGFAIAGALFFLAFCFGMALRGSFQ
jgi:hypothetical protein